MKSKINDIRLLTNGIEFISRERSDTCVCDMFLRKLNELIKVEKKFIIKVHLTNDKKFHLKVYDIIEDAVDVDFFYEHEHEQNMNDLSDEDVKRITLSVLYQSILSIAKKLGWDLDKISQAYENCIREDIKNEYFFKNKLFSSHDGNFYVGIYNIFTIHSFNTWLILYDKNKNELSRNLIYKDSADFFKIKSLAWVNNDSIAYKFDGPNKVFVYNVNQILHNQLPSVPKKIHLLFKN